MGSKLKQLTKDTALYGISTVVGRFINFILIPFYTNVLPPADYGIVANVYSYLALLNIVFLFGMDTAYLKYAGMSEKDERPKLFVQAFLPVALADILLFMLILTARPAFAGILALPDKYLYLPTYMGVILILDSLASLPFITLRLQKKALRFSMFKLLNIVLTLILNVVLILVLHWGIEAVLISNVVASAVTLVLLLPVVAENLKAAFQWEIFRKMAKFGLPYLPAGIASMFLQVIDRPIVQQMMGYKWLGIYQANYRLGIFMMLFVNMFQFAWQPFFLENAKDENAKTLFAQVFTYFTAAGCIILVLLSCFIPDLARLQYHGHSLIGREYQIGLYIVPVVLLAYLFNGFYANFSAGLFIKEKSIVFPIILGIGALSNVIFNKLMIPHLGIMGAALATLFSYILMAIGFYYVSNKYYPIKYEFKKLAIILSCTTITGMLFYMPGAGVQDSLILKIILAASFIGSLFATKVFSIKQFAMLRRSKVG